MQANIITTHAPCWALQEERTKMGYGNYHESVESAVIEAAGLKDLEAPAVAVTAIPDPKRHERLIVIHTKQLESPSEVCRKLSAGPLPKLWLPSPDDFVMVEAIPVLGTGKIDLRAIRSLAESKFLVS